MRTSVTIKFYVSDKVIFICKYKSIYQQHSTTAVLVMKLNSLEILSKMYLHF